MFLKCLKMTVIFQGQVKWVGHRLKSSNFFFFLYPLVTRKKQFFLQKVPVQDTRFLATFPKAAYSLTSKFDLKLEGQNLLEMSLIICLFDLGCPDYSLNMHWWIILKTIVQIQKVVSLLHNYIQQVFLKLFFQEILVR